MIADLVVPKMIKCAVKSDSSDTSLNFDAPLFQHFHRSADTLSQTPAPLLDLSIRHLNQFFSNLNKFRHLNRVFFTPICDHIVELPVDISTEGTVFHDLKLANCSLNN